MENQPVEYDLCLFVAGDEPNSRMAKKNIAAIFNTHLKEAGRLTIVDVFDDYKAAIAQDIVLTPVLVVKKPIRLRIMGNLSDSKTVLTALGVA